MIDAIRKPIAKEFLQYEKAFDESIKSETYLLNYVLKFMSSQKGKELRPQLVLLAAGLCGKILPDTIQAAVSLELLHTASLMHDDVVDNTYQRRSAFSVKALWNNKTAILIGDYYLSKSASISSKIPNRRISTLLAELGCELSEGEIMQLSNERRLIIDEPAYLEVIRKKTAKTFAFCTQAGAISVDADERFVETLRLFGEYMGMIFQIKDDIFDYFDSGQIGKPTCNDLKEGKMTLPLIYSLQNANMTEAKPFLNMIKNKDFSHENLSKINRFVLKSGGVEYAEKRMNDFKLLAVQALDIFQESPYKRSMLACLDYFMTRNY